MHRISRLQIVRHPVGHQTAWNSLHRNLKDKRARWRGRDGIGAHHLFPIDVHNKRAELARPVTEPAQRITLEAIRIDIVRLLNNVRDIEWRRLALPYW